MVTPQNTVWPCEHDISVTLEGVLQIQPKMTFQSVGTAVVASTFANLMSTQWLLLLPKFVFQDAPETAGCYKSFNHVFPQIVFVVPGMVCADSLVHC